MFFYYAYGLCIRSEIEIPEFVSTSAKSDVSITINREASIADHLSEAAIELPWALHLTRKKALVYVKDTGVFLINDGKKIVFIPVPQTLEQVVRFYIVGTVMAILLYQREFLVLHGSVIDFNGKAVIFLGNSGDGKSSIAAALHAAGHSLVNDDVAPVTLREERPAFLQPGFPQIKMSPGTANALGYDFESLALIHPQSEKRAYRPQYHSRSPLSIERIYVLEYGPDFGIAPIAPSLATMELSRHSRPTTLYQRGDALHFFQCAELVKKQTIYRLRRPKDLKLLPKIAEFVAMDLTTDKPMAIK